MLVGSFMSSHEIQAHLAGVLGTGNQYANWSLLPEEPSFRFYIALLIDSPEVFNMFWNSVKITGMVLLGQVFVGIPAAWGACAVSLPFSKSSVCALCYFDGYAVSGHDAGRISDHKEIRSAGYVVVSDPSGDFFCLYCLYCVCFVSENSGRSAGGGAD